MKTNIDIQLGDNLEIMSLIDDNKLDMIYSDILYGTGRKFNDYQDLKPNKVDIEKHYIPRIKEMHRILKESGSLYLQMDMRICHWVRLICDDIFGYDNFMSEIIWIYNTQGYSKNNYSAKHDNILFYAKNKKQIKLNIEENRQEKPSKSTIERFLPEALKNKGIYDHKSKKFIAINSEDDFYKVFKGHPPYSWVDFNVLTGASLERIEKYDTQKPLELIKHFIKISSNEYDLVGGFYAGSFTTAEACLHLNRSFIGCDITEKAVSIGLKRTQKK